MKLGIIAPLVFGSSGFARAGRQIMFNLADSGVELQLYGIPKLNYDGIISREEFNRLSEFTIFSEPPDIWFNLAPQCMFSYNESHKGYKIGMSMFETLYNPPSFVQQCTKCDEIWVPSEFNFTTFNESSKVPKEKLAYMPLGVETDLYSPRPSKYKITDSFNTGYDFVYGIICGYSARKGVDLVLTAHHELFTESSRVALFIKGDSYGAKLFPKDMATIYSGESLINDIKIHKEIRAKTYKNKPIILYSFQSYPDDMIPEILLSLDAFVFPSRGEGFGLPPMEAMSCELPVVATSGTSMEEFMLPDISYPVKSNGWKPDPRCDWITNQYKDNLFADPDYITYRDAVWDIYSDRETAKNKGIRARQFVIENYDYKVITLRMKNRLEEIMNGKLSAESFWPHKYV